MKLGIIIPYRGDRPRFLFNLFRMIKAQTLQPTIIELVDYAPLSDATDITPRYRSGYNKLRDQNLDVIALMEVDDYYASDYLQTMVTEWQKAGRPDIFGTDNTIYYNLIVSAYFTMHHNKRSSAMSTLIRPDLNLTWPVDQDPYTDIHLWATVKGKVFRPAKLICLGIKHGVGKCGGKSHTDRLHRYTKEKNGTEDPDQKFLKEVLDGPSFEFYSNYFQNDK